MAIGQAIRAVRTSVRAGPLRTDRLGRVTALVAAGLIEIAAPAPRPDEFTERRRAGDGPLRPLRGGAAAFGQRRPQR